MILQADDGMSSRCSAFYNTTMRALTEAGADTLGAVTTALTPQPSAMHRPTMPMVADTSTPEESISDPRRLALNRHGPAHFFISPLMKARKSALTRSGSMIAIP